jgi:hypothetical protein
MRDQWSRFVPVLAALLSLLMSTPVGGQKKKAAPVPSVGPNLAPLHPAGAAPGQSIDLTLTGTNLAGPTGLAPGFSAKVTIPSDNKNGQDNSKLRVHLDVPAEAPLGAHPLHLASTRGISNMRLFSVDDVPQTLEAEGNHDKAKSQSLVTPCVVDGKTDAEKADYFKIVMTAGQRLSLDLLGRRLGSALDAQLSIYHPKTQRELAHDNDSPGCQGDPRLRFTCKEAGEYLIEVKDVLNRGGPEYFYRLRVGDFPLAIAPIPMAARRGAKVKVQFAGPAVEGVAPVEVAVPVDPRLGAINVSPKGASGLHGWPVVLALSDHDEAVEQEPNNEPAKANRISVPSGITGRFQPSDDTDCYVFAAKKGQKLLLDVRTLELSSPTLVYMVLKNAKTGAELAKSNPQLAPPADQRLEFTAAEEGDYVLELQHLNFAGGPNEVYHLTVQPAVTFEVNLSGTRFDLAPGGLVPIGVQVVRRGYTGPLDLTVLGPAGLSGSSTFKAGQNAGVLVVQAKDDMPLGPYTIAVQAKGTSDGRALTHLASVRATLTLEMNGLLYPPLPLVTQIALGVREKAPFSLAFKANPLVSSPGLPTTVTVVATRAKGFTDEIVLNPPTGLPATVPAPKIPAIAKGKDEVSFPLDLNAKTPVGEYYVLFTAKAKQGDKETATSAPPLVVTLGAPFALKVEPASLDLKPGAKAKLKVSASRHAGYKGPITLAVQKLPANVSAAATTIAADKDFAEVELSAAAAAAPGVTSSADVVGTATALNNLQGTSPAFAVRVQKK